MRHFPLIILLFLITAHTKTLSSTPVLSQSLSPQSSAVTFNNRGFLSSPRGNIEYQADDRLFEILEATNPGITILIHKLLGTFRDSTDFDPDLVDQEDGRKYFIRLEHPIRVDGVIMKSISIKGSAFKEAFETHQLNEDVGDIAMNFDQAKALSWDERGNAVVGENKRVYVVERRGALETWIANNEYNQGRDLFQDNSALTAILPIGVFNYTQQKGPNGYLSTLVSLSPFDVGEDKRRYDALRESNANPTQLIRMHHEFGKKLREFHRKKIHGSSHLDNGVWDTKMSAVSLLDFSWTEDKAALTPEQALAMQIDDVNGAIRTLTATISLAIERGSPSIGFHFESLKALLVGYFGRDILQQQKLNWNQFIQDEPILNQPDAPKNILNRVLNSGEQLRIKNLYQLIAKSTKKISKTQMKHVPSHPDIQRLFQDLQIWNIIDDEKIRAIATRNQSPRGSPNVSIEEILFEILPDGSYTVRDVLSILPIQKKVPLFDIPAWLIDVFVTDPFNHSLDRILKRRKNNHFVNPPFLAILVRAAFEKDRRLLEIELRKAGLEKISS